MWLSLTFPRDAGPWLSVWGRRGSGGHSLGGSALGSSAGLPWFGLDDLGPCLVRWVPETDALRGEELRHTRCKSLSETPPGPLYPVQRECVHTPTYPPPLNTKLKPISSTVSLNIHFPTPANRFVGRCHSGWDQGTPRTNCFRGSPHLPRCLAPRGLPREACPENKGGDLFCFPQAAARYCLASKELPTPVRSNTTAT